MLKILYISHAISIHQPEHNMSVGIAIPWVIFLFIYFRWLRKKRPFRYIYYNKTRPYEDRFLGS